MVLLGLAVAAAACHPDMKERQTIDRWLLCEECTNGERDSVVAMLDRASDYLGEAVKGPSPSQRENVRRQFAALDARLPDPPPGPFTRATFVAHYVDNFAASYQSRAAIALGLINTSRAREILMQAFLTDTTSRNDVLSAIRTAAPISVDSSDTVQSAPVDSYVRVNPTVTVFDAQDSAALRPLAGVPVVFQVESGGGSVTDSVQRTSANGSAAVQWRLGPGVDSVNVLRAVAAGRIVHFRATGRATDPRVVFTAQPTNVIEGNAFNPSVGIAVLDGWDQVATQFSGFAVVGVLGAGDSLVVPMVAGRADFPSLILSSSATGLRLRARVAGAREAMSQAFDVLP